MDVKKYIQPQKGMLAVIGGLNSEMYTNLYKTLGR